ncbi:MAG TPA: M10 family metallopeptidase C-terminal domain-containing protein [Burkholderiales bacterium]|nr:M10 family metallopeptidase C-terminal domain-containing protein [Burkholderiales bacterium]
MATAVGSSIALTGDARIDGLLQGGAWQFSGPALLTYSFSANTEPGDPVWSSYPALAAAFAAAATAWSNVANVAFAEAGTGSVITQSPADIAVALENDPTVPLVALSVFPDPQFVDASFLPLIEETRASYPNPEGDVLLNIGFSQLTDLLQPGGWGLWVLVHELGHALGLKHTADDGANGRPTFAELGIAAQDAVQHTVMSSNGAQIAVHGNPATPMPLDILAIQHIYGANLAYHTGDDVYVLANDGVMRTVWDAGGIDTFDASTLSFETTIDLREGAFSSHGTIVGTMTAVAYHTVIENAIGGAGSDLIIGNAAANALSGGPGFGNDTLDGGTGADTLAGGSGNDSYRIDNPADVVIEEAGSGTDHVFSRASSWTMPANVENLTLEGAGNFDATGNAGANVILGNTGANLLDGGLAPDRLEGAGGDDTYVIGAAG